MDTLRTMLSALALAAAISALTALPARANGGNVYVYGNVSAWEIRSDASRAYRCFAAVEYEGGTSLRIGFNSDSANLYISVADTSWTGLRSGRKQVVQIAFDDGEPMELSGTGIPQAAGSAALQVMIPPASARAFLASFRGGQQLAILANGAEIELSLAGSYRALNMLDECQSSMARHAPKTG